MAKKLLHEQCIHGDRGAVEVRRIGIWMVVVGGIATAVGLVIDAARHADDPTLSAREGVFDFSNFAHALFFGGIAVALLGLFALLVGTQIYRADARVTVPRRLAQVGAPIFAVALIAGSAAAAADSGLGDAQGEDAVDEGAAVAADDGAAHVMADGTEMAGDAHDEGAATGEHEGHDASAATGEATDTPHGAVIAGTATGDSPCEIAQPTPVSPGQVGTGEAGSEEGGGEHGDRGMVKPEDLTREQRVQLEQEMIAARTVVDQFPTVAAAEAGGYNRSTPYVPCIGAHYTNIARVATFDPAAPSELLYDGTEADSRLVGLSYLVFSGDDPPAGFAGENDPWHQHNFNGGLCFAGTTVIGGEDTTEAECEARGGVKRELEGIWMMHAWVVPGFECSWGVFAGECPELGGRVGGTAWDEPAPAD
ncbi:MAG: hypothetical protein ACT4OX_11090 [Actinomycetota bacterium]